MLINQAYAATEVAAKSQSSISVILMNLVPFVLIFLVFYLILILPQRRKQKALRQMLSDLKHGDKIILSSGIVAKVVRVKDNDILLVKTAENTELEVLKNAVVNVIKD